MDGLWSALAAIGGGAVVGLMLDLAMRRASEERLREAMTRWWAGVASVGWSNFGATEAERALAILDRWVGRRLWSWRRACATLVVVGAWAGAGVLWLSLSLPRQDMGDWSYAQRFPYFWTVSDLVIPTALMLAAIVVLFAVSLSIFRGLARLTTGAAPRGAPGVLFFAGMLLVHSALLLYWNAVVVLVAVAWPSDLLVRTLPDGEFAAALHEAAYTATPMALDDQWAARLSALFSPWAPGMVVQGSGYADLTLLIGSGLDVTSNGLRLGFALLFLGSCLFRPIVQPAVVRLWAARVATRTPVFTILFALAGGAWALGSALMG